MAVVARGFAVFVVVVAAADADAAAAAAAAAAPFRPRPWAAAVVFRDEPDRPSLRLDPFDCDVFVSSTAAFAAARDFGGAMDDDS